MKFFWRKLLLAFAVAAGVLSPATVSFAHAGLLGSEPAASSVLAESPTEIVLRFDESLEPVFESIRILDPTGALVVAAVAQRDKVDHSIVRGKIPVLEDGTYVVFWRVTSADGNPVSGAFQFSIGANQEDVTNTVGDFLHASHSESSGSTFSILLRWTVYLGSIVLIGSVVLMSLITRADELDERSRRVVWGAWLLATVGSAVSLFYYGSNATGAGFYSPSLIGQTMQTMYGQMTSLRLLLLACLAVAISLCRQISQSRWTAIVLTASVLIILTFSLSGHAFVQSPAALSVLIDIVHLTAASVWIGGVVMLGIGGKSWYLNHDGRAIRRFSRLAGWCVSTVVVSGVAQAWLMMGSFGALFDTAYGRTLLVKTSAVLMVIALGLLLRVTIRSRGAASVKRIVGVETIIGIVIIAITSLLVGTPTREVPITKPFTVALVRSNVIANITITPARVGRAEVHITIVPPGGAFNQVDSVTARMSLPERNIPNVPIELTKVGPNHFVGIADISYPGEWYLDVTIMPSGSETLLYQTSFTASK